uniref:Transposase n=1 Tax=Heterorhabditis bacteriophora TaxID=37862 RepID=A0A1I7XID8_HETBA
MSDDIARATTQSLFTTLEVNSLYFDGTRCWSFDLYNLDDLIIDEILSLEDEQRRTSGKTQPVSIFRGSLVI